MQSSRDKISIVRFEPLLETTTAVSGANLCGGGNFEGGSLVPWDVATNWSIIDATTSEPTAGGGYAAQAASGSTGVVSTLRSLRVVVVPHVDYFVSFLFGAPKAASKKNNLKALVEFWVDNSVGSALVQARTIQQAPVRASAKMHYRQVTLTVPAGATRASIKFINTYGGAGAAGAGVVIDNVKIAARIDTPVGTPLETWQHGPLATGGDRPRFHDLVVEQNWHQGYKTAKFNLYGTPEYLWQLLQTGLGDWVEIYGTDARKPLFEGTLWAMRGRIRNADYEISLDTLGNFARVPYTVGTRTQYHSAQDADSILKYGRKDIVVSDTADSEQDARDTANYLIAQNAFPIPASVAGGGAAGNNVLGIELVSLWGTLGWVSDLAPVWRGAVDTATLVQLQLDRIINETPNSFLSRDYTQISLTGRTLSPPSAADTAVDALTTIQGLIERGDSSQRSLVAGVGPRRTFFMHRRATALAYFAQRGADGELDFFDAAGAPVDRQRIEPGNFVIFSAPVPQYSTVRAGDIARDPSAKLITNVSYDHEKDAMHIEVLGHLRFDVGLARSVHKHWSIGWR